MLERPVLGSEKFEGGDKFMALCIDPSVKDDYKGIARVVNERKGDVNVVGFVDRSKLILVESDDLLKWNILGDLKIKGIDEVIKKFESENIYFVGLEDPDIFVDDEETKHVYFTIAYKYKEGDDYKIYLGHASGKSLDNLVASDPIIDGIKEVAISPVSNNGYRYVLAESWFKEDEEGIAMIRANNMGKDWKFDKLVFDPAKKNSPSWCKGYASPCRFFDPSLVNIGENLLLGVCTGNSGEYTEDGVKKRGDFEPGLFVFDYKTGSIPWIAEESLFKDPLAKTITFASELVTTSKHEAILYAHPNDSFVRAYKLDISKLKKLVPNKFKSYESF
tara:strand:- start:54 stop:1052 length:999 start_codon:yes stop_codon:yes gene_type:complete